MTSPDFERCHAVTAKWEGGWSNHKDDPGGATMYGVIQTVYDAYRDGKSLKRQSVRHISRNEALDIFFNNYWQAGNCEPLWPGVDLAVYDASVNSGVSRGRKWLMASLGSDDHSVTVKRICQKRLSFVQGLRIFSVFGKGWTRRIADVQAKGVAWALAAMHGPIEAKIDGRGRSGTAKAKTAKSAEARRAVTAGGGDRCRHRRRRRQSRPCPAQLGDWLTYGLDRCRRPGRRRFYLSSRPSVNRQQAEAYAREAETLNA